MIFEPTDARHSTSELRLLLEELSCELCRYEHAEADLEAIDEVRIDREFNLGRSDSYADIRVVPRSASPYFVEVKFGYPNELLLRHIRRKFGEASPALSGANKVVLVVDLADRPNWPDVERELATHLAPGLRLEVWDEHHFIGLLKTCFSISIPAITPTHLLEVRQVIDRAQGYLAFGAASREAYVHEPLNAELLWHFGFWKVRRLRQANGLSPRDVLPPGNYRGVGVILADLCSFSSYVRDTADPAIVRENLTAFYSRARYQIINSGGMLYQFVGDQVVGLFGIPERDEHFAETTLNVANALLSIGNSVSQHWQRQIDRVQSARGVHIGLAVGDLQIASLRPFGRTHIGAIGDCINVAARLQSAAGPGEICMSNSFLQFLSLESRNTFREIEPLEAKNVGRIKAWKRTADVESHL